MPSVSEVWSSEAGAKLRRLEGEFKAEATGILFQLAGFRHSQSIGNSLVDLLSKSFLELCTHRTGIFLAHGFELVHKFMKEFLFLVTLRFSLGSFKLSSRDLTFDREFPFDPYRLI